MACVYNVPMRLGDMTLVTVATALITPACSYRPLSFAGGESSTSMDAGGATIDTRGDAAGEIGADATPEVLTVEISPSAFAALMVGAICDGMDACCHRAGIANDPAWCRTLLKNAFPHSADAIYNPAAAAACIAEEMAYVNGCGGDKFFNWPGVGAEPLLAACRSVFRETTPIGAPCTRWDECDSSTADYVCYSTTSGPGQCVLSQSWMPSLRLGEPCVVSAGHGFCYSFCEAGTYCDTSGHCVPLRDTGSCDDQCGSACNGATAYCDPSQGVCLRRGIAGSACVSDILGDCLPNLGCVKNVCQPAILRHCAI